MRFDASTLLRVGICLAVLLPLACGGGGGAPGDPPDDTPSPLPPLLCTDAPAVCSELIAFEPDAGEGYVDLLLPGETAMDEKYDYVRRDVRMALVYAAAKVARVAETWAPGNGAPIGIAYGSESDGATPGTADGSLLFPAGTHEDGRDVAVAYYQVGTADNGLRAVCPHMPGGVDAFHCTAPPDTLDAARTALFIACLAEHPELRVVGVDPEIGLVLESALDDLVTQGVISATLRAAVPLVYEAAGGWGLFHHTHMFVGFQVP